MGTPREKLVAILEDAGVLSESERGYGQVTSGDLADTLLPFIQKAQEEHADLTMQVEQLQKYVRYLKAVNQDFATEISELEALCSTMEEIKALAVKWQNSLPYLGDRRVAGNILSRTIEGPN